MNEAQETLPQNVNLALWKRIALLDACKLCRKRQTLLHVLNQLAIDMRRYNTRHNAVLEFIEKGIRPHLSEGDSLLSLVDLPNIHPYTFPPILICHLILFFGTIETELYALWNSPSAMSQYNMKKYRSIRQTSVQI